VKRNNPSNPRGRHRAPPAPDTPELAEQRAQSATAQAMIQVTRRLLAEGGLAWATDRRIHSAGSFTIGTMRYWFGGREGLFVQVARTEHLARIDLVRRTLREVRTTDELLDALIGLADARDHYRVVRALLDASVAMPDLAVSQHRLWEDWRERMGTIVLDLQSRGVVRGDLDPDAIAIVWSAISTGLAAHREAQPTVDLRIVRAVLQAYTTQAG
jgi:hypothetical protein